MSASPDATPILTADASVQKTVAVRGLSRSFSADHLGLYFENSRKSGGGPVEKVTDNGRGVFYVTFENEEDAANVLTKADHIIDKVKVTVCLETPPSAMKDRVLLRNVPEELQAEELKMLVENKTGYDVTSIRFADESVDDGLALVVFESAIDLEKARAGLSKAKYQGIEVDTVCASDQIVVQDVPDDANELLLELYFENVRKSNGGEVREVFIPQGSPNALITFASAEVAERVSKRKHEINTKAVTVCVYHDVLGPEGGRCERSIKIPDPAEIPTDIVKKVSLILETSSMITEMSDKLKNHWAAIQISPSSKDLSLVCLISKDTKDGRNLVKTWHQAAVEALRDFLSGISTADMVVRKDEFDEAKAKLRQEADSSKELVEIIFDEKLELATFVFHPCGQEVVDTLKKILSDTQKHLDRVKCEVQETVNKNPHKLKMMIKKHIDHAIRDKYPLLKVDVDEVQGTITLKGLQEEINEARHIIIKEESSIVSISHTFKTPQEKQLMQSEKARDKIAEFCQKEDPDGQVSVSQDGFTVWSFEKRNAQKMILTGESAIHKKTISLSPEQKNLEELDEVLAMALSRNNDTMVIDVLEDRIIIMGVNDNFDDEVLAIETCIEEKTTNEENLSIKPELYGLFNTTLLTQGEFLFDPASVAYHASKQSVRVKAPRNILKKIKAHLTNFMQGLVTKTTEYREPSFNKFINSETGRRKLDLIEKVHKCKVVKVEEDAERATPFGSLPSAPGGQASVDGLQTPAREFDEDDEGDGAVLSSDQRPKTVPKCLRIYHHIFVNSTNPDLDLSHGQVAKALLGAGGQTLQNECFKKYPDGIQCGQVAVTGPGRTKEYAEKHGKTRLYCLRIFHCCLPEVKDKSNTEQIKSVIKVAVENCLKLAETAISGTEKRSIGFPVLGCGNLGYPPEVVAATMYDTVMEYGNKHPQTLVSDVFFILYKNDKHIHEVFAREEKRYKILKGKEADEENFLVSEPTSQGMQHHPFFEETRGSVKVTLTGISADDLQKAFTDLLREYELQIRDYTHEFERLDRWDDAYVHQTKMSCKAADVDLTFNFSLGKIRLRGHKDFIDTNLFHNIFSEAEANLSERENARLTSFQVQWNWVEVILTESRLRPYDMVNNYRIEKAYRDKKAGAIVFDKNKIAYNINFDTMKEVPELIGPNATFKEDDAVQVIRQDKMTEGALNAPPPDHWKPMMGQQLDVVVLKESDLDYRQVRHDFMASIHTDSPDISQQAMQIAEGLVKIVKIERVQNLTLHKQYCAMKQGMQLKFPAGYICERRPVWHGTKEASVENIIKYGFNRSYCQRTHYGEAVYFAKSAKYSSQETYAKKDQAGERHMFYCRVLVGKSIKGADGMRFLPQTGGKEDYDTAVDDMTDPSVFVVFKDAQAYPEYHIVFKDK